MRVKRFALISFLIYNYYELLIFLYAFWRFFNLTDRIKPMRTSPFFRLSLLSAALVGGFAYADGETAGQEQDQELQTVYITAQRQLQ